MLRMTLGMMLLRGIRGYYDSAQKQHREQRKDLREALEKSSGQNLREFSPGGFTEASPAL